MKSCPISNRSKKTSVLARLQILGLLSASWISPGELLADSLAETLIPQSATVCADKKISDVLTLEDEKEAVSVVTQFIEADSVEQRLKQVRDPERVKPLMENWYKGKEKEELPDGEVLRSDKIKMDGRFFIRLYIKFGETGGRMYILEHTEEHIRLDWETAVNFKKMPLEEFKEKRPTTPVEFRVKAKPGDYYANQFIDKERYASVALSYPGDIDFKLNGYVDREKDWAAKLIGDFEKGVAPSLIVNLRYPEGEIKDPSQVEIDSIVSESWLVRPEDDKKSDEKISSESETVPTKKETK